MAGMNRVKLARHVSYNPNTGTFTRVSSIRRPDSVGRSPVWVSCKRHSYVTINSRLYLAHRLAWLWVHGRFPRWQIDHINGDRHDNRIANLREATNAQNQMNRRKRDSRTTSRFKGVSWAKRERRWRSCIVKAGRQSSLGYFRDEIAAARAYNAAARKMFGVFASLNSGV